MVKRMHATNTCKSAIFIGVSVMHLFYFDISNLLVVVQSKHSVVVAEIKAKL